MLKLKIAISSIKILSSKKVKKKNTYQATTAGNLNEIELKKLTDDDT